MQISTAAANFAPEAAERTSSRIDRLLGLVVMAVLPAIFWTAVLAWTAPLFGYDPSTGDLAKFAGSVGVFLACVCCAVTSRSN
ncbi:MAG: hypothetical protein KDJ47_12745 [Hyphomicrobiaceae bacterium]|nr:hypothetical protein [Hyphomicrobiaceae bacterium]